MENLLTRKLASIQKIESVEPIEGADRIQKARVLGWGLVVLKDEFVQGDLCVYFEIDSVLPKTEWSAFMEKRKYRVKTMRMRGTLSQGLALPLSILPTDEPLSIGDDVTDILGVTKYEPPMPRSLDAMGPFPYFISKTDELRVQSYPDVLKELVDVPLVATVKLDGQSATYANWNDEFWVCSRNMRLKENCLNQFWDMSEKYRLAEILEDGFVIQGEICGPGIQKNRLGLKEVDLFVFNVYDLNRGDYYHHADVLRICKDLKLTMVPEDFRMTPIEIPTIEEFLTLAQGFYKGTSQAREGIVIRALYDRCSLVLKGRLSFKVVNNDYLLRNS